MPTRVLLLSSLACIAALQFPSTVPLRPSSLPAAQRCTPITALAPSGIDGLPLTEQAEVVAGIFAALGIGAFGTARVCEAIGDALPVSVTSTATKIGGALLGAVFMAAGFSHFALPEAYYAIFPPQGTWGLWYLPGSAEFYVAATGLAEGLGGLGMFLGGVGDLTGLDGGGRARPLRQLCASSLFVLMVAVFPVNIYQYTHGAIMVGAGPDGPLDLSYHYVRLALQIGLLVALELLSKEEGRA